MYYFDQKDFSNFGFIQFLSYPLNHLFVLLSYLKILSLFYNNAEEFIKSWPF